MKLIIVGIFEGDQRRAGCVEGDAVCTKGWSSLIPWEDVCVTDLTNIEVTLYMRYTYDTHLIWSDAKDMKRTSKVFESRLGDFGFRFEAKKTPNNTFILSNFRMRYFTQPALWDMQYRLEQLPTKKPEE